MTTIRSRRMYDFIHKSSNKKNYDDIKEHNGQKYSGMKVGGKHIWDYKQGIWKEIKISPNKWKIEFTCNKYRKTPAPPETGAPIKTGFHWYIIADQKAVKINENMYETIMSGIKFKIGHKRPNWKQFSYNYSHNESYEDVVIKILEETLEKLKLKKKKKELKSYF
ncbi:MAG: hypothetical protein ACTSRG_12235 [Candidatus Helarchaeota archaeon]